MIKLLVLLILVGLSVNVYSQSFNTELYRYWFYRDRLQYFVYPGTEAGNSVVCTYRNPPFERIDQWVQSTANTIVYGQTYKLMGYYLGMLATEYRLLLDNGQNSDAIQTLSELNLALDALIRMDKCESNVPWNCSQDYYDGFFTRCDVPPVLSQPMTDYLNDGLETGSVTEYRSLIDQGYKGFAFEIKPTHVNAASKYEDPTNEMYQIRNNNSDINGTFFIPLYNQQQEEYWDYWKSGNFTSNDEIVGIYMGLALVCKYVEEPFVLDKARNIAKKILDFAIIHPACTTPALYDAVISLESCIPTQMRYPNLTAISSNDGGISIGILYGLIGAYNKMVDSNTDILLPLISALEINTGVLNVNIKSIYKTIVRSLSLINGNLEITVFGNTYTLIHGYDRGMYEKLVAISDRTGANLPTPSMAVRTIGNEFNWHTFYMMLWAAINNKDLTSSIYNFPFDLLINDMATAPCSGPYNYVQYNGDLSVGWCNQYKYDSDLTGQNEGGIESGTYPGLDYMLLYNLACLAFPNGFDYEGQHYSFPYYVNMNNRILESTYLPAVLPGNPNGNHYYEFGSTNNPGEIRAISTIVTNMIVANEAHVIGTNQTDPTIQGDVTLKAGESIKLTDGFRVDAGAHFLARIESYSCNGLSYKNMAAPPWDENYRGCFYDTLISVPMDQRTPIVYSEDNYEEADFDMPLWDDYHYTYDTTATTELAVGTWLNPNPCGSSATLTVVSENEQQLTIDLYDMSGVKRETVFNDIADINLVIDLDLSSYASGTYMLRITGSGGVKVLRFVKE